MKRSSVGILLFFALFATGQPALSQVWGAVQPRPAATPSDSLKKGEFTWAPELSGSGPILVMVNLSTQRSFVYRNGILIGTSTVSTGKPGHETPTGVFHTFLKDAHHRSKKYNNAPMPFTEEFTSSGIALHAGGLPGYPSSHGCVHLPSYFAEKLFAVAPLGMTVVVTKAGITPTAVLQTGFLSPVTKDGKPQQHPLLSANDAFRWTPEKSTTGAVSVLVSSSDNRMIVFRNGIEIGRSRISFAIAADSITPYVYQLQETASGELSHNNWTVVPVDASQVHQKSTISPKEQLTAMQIPAAFQSSLATLLAPGLTLVITNSAILPSNSGKNITVITSKSSNK